MGNTINFENLKYFIAAAEDLNFTATAKRLYITQQALSKQISQLEKHYDVRLFNRTKPMTLTEAGEILYRNVRRMEHMERQLETEMHDLKEQINGILTIGVSQNRGQVLLPPLLSAYHEKYPDVQLVIYEDNLENIMKALRLGKIDLARGYDIHADISFCNVKMGSERMCAVIPENLFREHFSREDQKAIAERGVITLKELECCPMIRMAPASFLGNIIDDCCEKEQLSLKIVMISKNPVTILRCCQTGMGAAILPEVYLNELSVKARKEVRVFQWDYKGTNWSGGMMYLKNSYLSRAAEAFLKTCLEQ
ncbi:MAG: LysR family transcriptional regulator [Lachnospiraceae bacterium]|nr:LysR family transcriptional regulator [Lachnospiraceae bacterium]